MHFAAATTPRFVLLLAAPLGAAQPTRPDHLDRLTARATSDSSRRLQHRVDHWRRIMRIDAAVRILASAAVAEARWQAIQRELFARHGGAD